ncbi:response regulator [Paenibacillus alba]|uniref:response regulator n=1 Tax=Paenibacillus alba TaxID=1197127 RepID=UPI001565C7E7|nr:response regulator [Paenibacillus alba]
MHKAILADDERRIRNAIRKLGDWEEIGIQIVKEVQDGDELWESVASDAPDLVITDMRMPGLSGANLIKRLSEAYPGMKLIVMSGYDDFEYMKQAIASKVIDYLLKPVHKDALNEALRATVKEIASRNDNRQASLDVQRKLNESLPLLNENILNQFLNGSKGNEEEFIRCLDISNLPSKELGFTTVVLAIENYKDVADRKFRSDPYLLLFAIVNMADEVLKGWGKSFRSRQDDNEIIMIFYKSTAHDELLQLLEDVNDKLRQFLHVFVLIGVGSSYPSPIDLKHSLNEARAALSQLNTKEQSFRISVYDKMKLHARAPRIPAGINDKQLGAALDTGNVGLIKQTVEQAYRELSLSDYMSISDIRKLNADLLFQIERLVDAIEDKSGFISELTALRHKIGNELNLHFVQSSILQFIESLSRYEVTQRKERRVIYVIRDYLDQNYTRKHSLKELSDTFFLSKEYISRIFKEEFGMNLFEHIAALKIEKAGLMLISGDRKIREIVDELGFNDESHFSKAFKKHTGLSPRAYRDQWK